MPSVGSARRSSRIRERRSVPTNRRRDREPSRAAASTESEQLLTPTTVPARTGNHTFTSVSSLSEATGSLPLSTAGGSQQQLENFVDTINVLSASVNEMRNQLSCVTNVLRKNSLIPDSDVPVTTSIPEQSSNMFVNPTVISKHSTVLPSSVTAGNNITTTTSFANGPLQLNVPTGSSSATSVQLPISNSNCNLPMLNVQNNSQANNMSSTLQQALPLGVMVPDSIKNKIWANEYIDFGSLLPVSHHTTKALPIVVENSQLALQDKPKQIKTIDEWVSAFSVFMAIYTQKFSDSTQELLKYMDIVRSMAKQKGNWYLYDMEFRRSKCQLSVSWGNMHHHLWLLHMVGEKQENQIPQLQHQQGVVPRIPYGYCIKFHLGKFCPLPCNFNHRCFICNLPHSASRCWHQHANLQPNVNHTMGNQRYSFRAENFRPFQSPQARPRSSNAGFQRPTFRYSNSQFTRRDH